MGSQYMHAFDLYWSAPANAGPPGMRFGIYGNAMGLPGCPGPVTEAGMNIYEPSTSQGDLQPYDPYPKDPAAENAGKALKIFSKLLKFIPEVGNMVSSAMDQTAEAIGAKSEDETRQEAILLSIQQIKDELQQLPSKIQAVLKKDQFNGLHAKMDTIRGMIDRAKDSHDSEDPDGYRDDAVIKDRIQPLMDECNSAHTDALRVQCQTLVNEWTWENKQVLDLLPGIHLLVVQCFLAIIAIRARYLQRAQKRNAVDEVDLHTRHITFLQGELKSFQTKQAENINSKMLAVVNERRAAIGPVQFWTDPKGRYDGRYVGLQYIWGWYDSYNGIRWCVASDGASLHGCEYRDVDVCVRQTIGQWHQWFVNNFEVAQQAKTRPLVKLCNRLKGIPEEMDQCVEIWNIDVPL